MPTRVEIYQGLTEVVQNLMDKIYGDKTGFINTSEDNQHPLEPYLIQFDDNMESSIVTAIANRIGLTIFEDPVYSATDQFIDEISIFLDREKYSPIDTATLINVNWKPFQTLALKYGRTPTRELYENRLIQFTQST